MNGLKTLPIAILATFGLAAALAVDAATIAKPGASVSGGRGGGGHYSGGGGGRYSGGGQYGGGRYGGYSGGRHGAYYGGHPGGYRHGHWHGGLSFHYGVPIWGPWYYGLYSSWPYYDAWYPSPYYGPAPYPYAVADAGPPPPTTAVPPIAEGAPTQRPLYLNYCESAKAYYPKVTTCPEGWRLATPGY